MKKKRPAPPKHLGTEQSIINKKEEIPKKELILSLVGEWNERIGETELLKLPSGIVVKIRKRASLVSFAMAGDIPLPLLREVIDVGGQMAKGSNNWDKVKEDGLTKTRGLLENIALLCVLEPKLSDKDEEGKINIHKVEMDDLLAIFGTMVRKGDTMRLLLPFLS